jgi:hypothetical protein
LGLPLFWDSVRVILAIPAQDALAAQSNSMRLEKIVRPVFYSLIAIALAAVTLLGLSIYRNGIRIPTSILNSGVAQDIALRYGVRYSMKSLEIGCLGRDCPLDIRAGALDVEIQIPEPLRIHLDEALWSRGNPLTTGKLEVRSGNRPPLVRVDKLQADLSTLRGTLYSIQIGLLPNGPSPELGSVAFDANAKEVIAHTLKLSSVNVDTIQLNGWATAADNYIALDRLDITGIHVSPSQSTAPVTPATTICQQLPSTADLGGDVMAPFRPLLPLLLKDIQILHGDLWTIALVAAIAILILKLLSLLWLWRSPLMLLLPIFTAAAPFALYFLLGDALLVAAGVLAVIAILLRVFVYRRGERWYQRWEPFVVDLASVVVLLPLLGLGIALPPFPEPPAGLQLDRIEVADIDGRPTGTAQFDIPKATIQGLRIALPGTDPQLEVGVSSIEIPKTNIRVAPSSRITLDGMLVDEVNVAYDPSRREVGNIGAHAKLAGLFESDALARELRNIEFLRGIDMRSRVGFDADVRAAGPEAPSRVSTQFPRSKNLVAVNAAINLKPVECTVSFDVATRIQTEPLMLTARADGDTESIRIRSLRSIPGSPIQVAGGSGSLQLSGAPTLSLNLDSIRGTFGTAGSTALSIASVGIAASTPAPGRTGIQSATIVVGPTSIRPASGLSISIAGSNIHMDRMQDRRSVPVTFETRIDSIQLESADKRIEANFPSLVARVTGQASPETIPRRFNGTVDFTAFGNNPSDELLGTGNPISFDADLWAGLLNVPEQEIRFHESLLSESQTEFPVQFKLAGRLSSIVPSPNADIEARAVIGHLAQDLGSARLALDNALVSGRVNWDDRGAAANLNFGIDSARIALSPGPSALCLDEISTLDISASGTISRIPESGGLPSLASARSVCAALPALPDSMQFRISGNYPVGPETSLVRLERENGTGFRIPNIVNEIRSLQIRDGRLVRVETRANILGVGTLQSPRSIDVQADLRQEKDSLQLTAGVSAPDGTRFLDVAVDSTPARLTLDATQHVAADRIVAQIQPFLSDLQIDTRRVNPQARVTQLHADVNFENDEVLNAAVVARLARGLLVSLDSPELRASVATSSAGVEPLLSLNIGSASGTGGMRRIVASANMSGANVHAVTDKGVALDVAADLGVIVQGSLFASGPPAMNPVLDKVFQVGSGLGRQVSQLAALLDPVLDTDATSSPIENLQWKARLLQNSPQAPLLQLVPDFVELHVATAAVDASWDSAISQERSRISLTTSLDSDIRLDRNDVLLEVFSPLALTYSLDGQPETRVDSNIPLQAVFSERLNRTSANPDSLWNPDYYAQFWRAHPSRFSGAAFATPIDFNELVLGPVSVREVRFPLEPLRIVIGYADALQFGLPFSGRVLFGGVTGNLETSITTSKDAATVDARLNLDLKNLQAGAIGSTISGGRSSFVEDELDGKVAFRTDAFTIDPTTLPALRAGHVSPSELEKLGISVRLSRSQEGANLPGVLQASSEVQINVVNELLNQIIKDLRLPAPPRALTYKDLALNFDVDRGQVRNDTEVFKLGGVQLFSSTAVDATAEVRAHLGRKGERVMLGSLIEMIGSFGSLTESGGR